MTATAQNADARPAPAPARTAGRRRSAPPPPPELVCGTVRAGAMFALSLVLLLLIGFSLPHGGVSDIYSDILWQQFWLPLAIALLWCLIVIEALIGVTQAADRFAAPLKRLLLNTLFAPSRLTVASMVPSRYLWLPRVGWINTGRRQQDELEKRLMLPMLLITLLILPVIGGELFFGEQVRAQPLLALAIHSITSLIWFAFTCEFLLMVSVAEKKLDYCKRHWINIVIILLPIVAFLRTLQLFRFLRVAKAGKLLRAYRLRGVFARALRLALMLNLIERVMQRNMVGYVGHLEEKLHEKEIELNELQDKLDRAKRKLCEAEKTV